MANVAIEILGYNFRNRFEVRVVLGGERVFFGTIVRFEACRVGTTDVVQSFLLAVVALDGAAFSASTRRLGADWFAKGRAGALEAERAGAVIGF